MCKAKRSRALQPLWEHIDSLRLARSKVNVIHWNSPRQKTSGLFSRNVIPENQFWMSVCVWVSKAPWCRCRCTCRCLRNVLDWVASWFYIYKQMNNIEATLEKIVTEKKQNVRRKKAECFICRSCDLKLAEIVYYTAASESMFWIVYLYRKYTGSCTFNKITSDFTRLGTEVVSFLLILYDVLS